MMTRCLVFGLSLFLLSCSAHGASPIRDFDRVCQATYARAALLHVEEAIEKVQQRGFRSTVPSFGEKLRLRQSILDGRLTKCGHVGLSTEDDGVSAAIDKLLVTLRASGDLIETSPDHVPAPLARTFEWVLHCTSRLRERLDADGALRPSSHLIVSIARLKGQTIDELACAKFFDGLLLAEYQESLRTLHRTRRFQLLHGSAEHHLDSPRRQRRMGSLLR